jgi:hypothetical protein
LVLGLTPAGRFEVLARHGANQLSPATSLACTDFASSFIPDALASHSLTATSRLFRPCRSSPSRSIPPTVAAKTNALTPRAVDIGGAAISIAAVSEKQGTRGASRYDAVIATLVGVCALFVSGYTAYMQRQQVRATVWPILEFESSNTPDIHLSLANKGVGPAIIRHVVVTVDGKPVSNWSDALAKILGPGYHPLSESDMGGRVLSPGESMTVFTPFDPDGKPLPFDKSNPFWVRMNKDRARIAVEICYSSTLGECWTLHGGGKSRSTTTEVRSCQSQSAVGFEQ